MNIKTLNNITINTDASFCPNSKVAGFAFYIKSDLFLIKKAGVLKSTVINSEDAEMMCLANALYYLFNETDNIRANRIIINIDCVGVIRKVKKGNNDALTIKTRDFMNALMNRTKAKIVFKHVLAHKTIINPRTWVNDWCDKTAKSYMRQARKENKMKIHHV